MRDYLISDLLAECKKKPSQYSFISAEAIVIEALEKGDSFFSNLFKKSNLEPQHTVLALIEFMPVPARPLRNGQEPTMLLVEWFARNEKGTESNFYEFLVTVPCAFSYHLIAAGLDRYLPLKVGTPVNRMPQEDTPSGVKIYSCDTPLLNMLGRNLSAEAANLDPVYGREDEIRSILEILCQQKQRNPMLIGQPGVGKSAVVEGLAKRINDDPTLPQHIRKLKIYQISIAALTANTKFRGEFSARMIELLAELQSPERIIFIDEVHSIMGAGGTDDSPSSRLENFFKPALSRGDLRLIGATTNREYLEWIARDSALARRFSIVEIQEPSLAESKMILSRCRSSWQLRTGLTISSQQTDRVVEIASAFLPEYQPASSFKLLDRAVSKALVENKTTLEPEHIERAVASLARVDIGIVRADCHEKYARFATALRNEIFGQDEAVEAFQAAIANAFLEIQTNGPMGAFFLAGPTGVGKTFCAQIAAKALFGSDQKLLRLDLAQFKDPATISSLIGIAPGYVGYQNGGQLTNFLAINPSSIILLDEVEKAHSAVMDVFLAAIDAEAAITDASGKKVCCRHAIFIFTSNIPLLDTGNVIGFRSRQSVRGKPDLRTALIHAGFRPEFVGRLQDILSFEPLDLRALGKIAERRLAVIKEKLLKSGYRLTVHQDVINTIVRDAGAQNLGARPIDHLITARIVRPASLLILNGLKQGSVITFSPEKDAEPVPAL
jgi:ATP-dependent Clp protease ATP-binding subunit ClpA